MGATPTVEEIVELLRPMARPGALEGMARFGIATESALGVSMPDLRAMGKSLGRNHELALELWRTPLRETRILASLVADPQQMIGGRCGCAWGGGFGPWIASSLIADMAEMRMLQEERRSGVVADYTA
jgi:DNA alkylation repair enzyme